MPEKPDREFLLVSLPETVEAGTNLRLLAIAPTVAEAQKAVNELGAGTLGRVAVLERKLLYSRRPAVESIEIDDPIIK